MHQVAERGEIAGSGVVETDLKDDRGHASVVALQRGRGGVEIVERNRVDVALEYVGDSGGTWCLCDVPVVPPVVAARQDDITTGDGASEPDRRVRDIRPVLGESDHFGTRHGFHD